MCEHEQVLKIYADGTTSVAHYRCARCGEKRDEPFGKELIDYDGKSEPGPDARIGFLPKRVIKAQWNIAKNQKHNRDFRAHMNGMKSMICVEHISDEEFERWLDS